MAETVARTETDGEEIGRRRVAARLSQSELARRAGVYRDTVGNIELGRSKNPRPDVIHSLLTALTQAEAELEAAEAPPTTGPPPIRVTVSGIFGNGTFTVEAPPENVAELERIVDRIMTHVIDASQRAAADQGQPIP